MAYADQQMSSRRMVAIAVVVLLHAIIGYAFITGLAYNVIKHTVQDLKTFDVDEPPPPPEKPPPPPPEQKVEPPPAVSPPPIVQTQTIVAPQIQTVPVAPPPVITPTAPVAPPPPPPPARAIPLTLKGSLQTLVSTDDYPPAALRNEEEGTVGFHLTIGADGRVTNCAVTASSGHSDLDETACRLLTRRARFVPGKDPSGAATGGVYDSRFRWQIPKE